LKLYIINGFGFQVKKLSAGIPGDFLMQTGYPEPADEATGRFLRFTVPTLLILHQGRYV
jgi:hypothetical protein